MNSCVVCVFIFIEFSVYAGTKQVDAYYKVSMVASEKNPGQPFLFDHAASPVWVGQRNSLLFVDAWKQDVHLLNYESGKLDTKHIAHGQVHLVSTVANSKRVLVAVRASLYLMDWEADENEGLRLLTTVDLGMPDNVINSGRADVKGRFWMGTKGLQVGDEVSPDCGTLYSVSQLELVAPRAHLRPVGISGGMAWALNNSVLYYTDASTQRVEAFDFDVDKRTISGRRTIIDVTAYGYDNAMPAGITIDTNGNLWVALMFGGTVLHIDPDTRHVIYGYKLPVLRTTAVTWGGPKNDELFVTTARRGADLAQEPLAGAIFTLRDTGSTGLPDHKFVFDDPDTY